ncbi:MAG TPA: 16S rRNA (cytosine(1402)-N(4))-methyltransferase RsmH [Candidatus Paceibacterota bacterium]
MAHIPVLLPEVLLGLTPKAGDIFLDATINGAGVSSAVSHELGASGTLIGIDLDREALALAKERLKDAPCKVILVEANFADIASVLQKQGIPKINTCFFDLGLSSNQLEHSNRGFSFQKDEPLLMTFAVEGSGRTAADIVNSATEQELVEILWKFGEERMARRIARAVVEARGGERILTSKQLAEIVEKVVPRRGKIHPATKTFQALRIAVNDEFNNLEKGLEGAVESLKQGGRIAVISFHSSEDRIVKHFFRKQTEEGKGIIITKKPIAPRREEMVANPRSRSSKLRIFEKTI